jgi:hypothetical protein
MRLSPDAAGRRCRWRWQRPHDSFGSCIHPCIHDSRQQSTHFSSEAFPAYMNPSAGSPQGVFSPVTGPPFPYGPFDLCRSFSFAIF